MSSIAIKWRQFKATLTSLYIYGKYKDKSACQKYGIDKETWEQSREDPSWQVCFHFFKIKTELNYMMSQSELSILQEKRRKAQEIAQKNVTPTDYLGGFMIYQKERLWKKS